MNAKLILYHTHTQQRLLAGVDALANAVKVTVQGHSHWELDLLSPNT